MDVDNSGKGLIRAGCGGRANEHPVLFMRKGIEGNLFEMLPVHEVAQRVGSAIVIGFILVYSITQLLKVDF